VEDFTTYTGSEQINPEYFNVFLMYSDDDGLTWTEPKIVHSDTSNFVQQYYSSIYVNDDGVLILDWYDRSNFENTNSNTDFFMGISYDGGESFTEIKFNTEPMDFRKVVEAGFGFGIGEYHQLVATNKTAISFWSDGRTNDGDLNIYFAKVGLTNPTTSVTEVSLINSKIEVSRLFPQPAKNQINLKIKLKAKEQIKVKIFSINGRLIDEYNWIDYNEGSHTIGLPINLVPGKYLLQLITKNGGYKNQLFIVA